MKKAISFVLTLAICLSLCACSSASRVKNTLQSITNTVISDSKEEEVAPKETVKPTAKPTEEKETAPETKPIGIRSEFKEAMDTYESFYDEYCDFMKEYQKNPTDLKLVAKYGEMLIKLGEMDDTFEAWDEDELSNEELKYYLEVHNRIMQRLVDITN